LSANPQIDAETEEEEELSPRAARAMRIVLWSVVAVMAAGWIFLFYNVLSRSLAPPAPPPPPPNKPEVAKAAAPAKPASAPAAPSPSTASKAAPQRVVVTIDTPVDGATVGQDFEIRGWALDGRSTTGSGVSAVHVYAYPEDGSPAIGLAGIGPPWHARADVAAAMGSQFEQSAFSARVPQLRPGHYVIKALAFSSVTERFEADRSIFVTVR
jgi:hypothetical protein